MYVFISIWEGFLRALSLYSYLGDYLGAAQMYVCERGCDVAVRCLFDHGNRGWSVLFVRLCDVRGGWNGFLCCHVPI